MPFQNIELFRSFFTDLLTALFSRGNLGLTVGEIEVQRPNAGFGMPVGLGRGELPRLRGADGDAGEVIARALRDVGGI